MRALKREPYVPAKREKPRSVSLAKYNIEACEKHIICTLQHWETSEE